MTSSAKVRQVNVLCPNGRRVVVKANVSTSIDQVIEEACVKHQFDPYNYNLRHLKRILDPSSTLHYSNIPNHAQLELVEAASRRQEKCVTVNLVTETGQRLIHDFPSSSSLWEILLHYEREDENSFSLPSPSSGLEPFIIYTMRKITSADLKSVTLKSLGLLSGKCMLRYNVEQYAAPTSNPVIVKPKQNFTLPSTSGTKVCNRALSDNTESMEMDDVQETNKTCGRKKELVEDIHKSNLGMEEVTTKEDTDEFLTKVSAESITKEEASSVKNSVAETAALMNSDAMSDEMSTQASEMASVVRNTSEEVREAQKDVAKAMEADDVSNDVWEKDVKKEISPKIIHLCDRGGLLFHSDDVTPSLRFEESDDFFDLTSDDVRKLHHEQVKQLRELEEAPLLTSQLRLLQQESRLLTAMNRHPVTQLRIFFPDGHVVQADFKPFQTVKCVMDFVKPLLVDPDLPFYLYSSFPRRVLQPTQNLVEAGCIPKARLYFGCDGEGTHFLSRETLAKKSSFEAASKAIVTSKQKVVEKEGSSRGHTLGGEHPSTSGVPSVSSVSRTSSAASTGATPKTRNPNSSSNKPKWFKLGK